MSLQVGRPTIVVSPSVSLRDQGHNSSQESSEEYSSSTHTSYSSTSSAYDRSESESDLDSDTEAGLLEALGRAHLSLDHDIPHPGSESSASAPLSARTSSKESIPLWKSRRHSTGLDVSVLGSLLNSTYRTQRRDSLHSSSSSTCFQSHSNSPSPSGGSRVCSPMHASPQHVLLPHHPPTPQSRMIWRRRLGMQRRLSCPTMQPWSGDAFGGQPLDSDHTEKKEEEEEEEETVGEVDDRHGGWRRRKNLEPRRRFSSVTACACTAIVDDDVEDEDEECSDQHLCSPSAYPPLESLSRREELQRTPAGSDDEGDIPLPVLFPKGFEYSLCTALLSSWRGCCSHHREAGDSCKTLCGADLTEEEESSSDQKHTNAAAGTASGRSGRGHAAREQIKFKTEICRSFEETGSCVYGDKCKFAHGPEELRSLPNHRSFKTRPCRFFFRDGSCQYGKKCFFIHQRENLPHAHDFIVSSGDGLPCFRLLRLGVPLEGTLSDQEAAEQQRIHRATRDQMNREDKDEEDEDEFLRGSNQNSSAGLSSSGCESSSTSRAKKRRRKKNRQRKATVEPPTLQLQRVSTQCSSGSHGHSLSVGSSCSLCGGSSGLFSSGECTPQLRSSVTSPSRRHPFVEESMPSMASAVNCMASGSLPHRALPQISPQPDLRSSHHQLSYVGSTNQPLYQDMHQFHGQGRRRSLSCSPPRQRRPQLPANTSVGWVAEPSFPLHSPKSVRSVFQSQGAVLSAEEPACRFQHPASVRHQRQQVPSGARSQPVPQMSTPSTVEYYYHHHHHHHLHHRHHHQQQHHQPEYAQPGYQHRHPVPQHHSQPESQFQPEYLQQGYPQAESHAPLFLRQHEDQSSAASRPPMNQALTEAFSSRPGVLAQPTPPAPFLRRSTTSSTSSITTGRGGAPLNLIHGLHFQ